MITDNAGNQIVQIARGLLDGQLPLRQANTDLSQLKIVPATHNELFHFLYHYLADEDIRLRDSEYAKYQRQKLQSLLEGLT